MNIELINWADVKADSKLYAEDDNNNGYVFGYNLLDDFEQIIDCEWFKTDKERSIDIEKHSLNIV